MNKWLPEQLKTVRNLIDISEFILEEAKEIERERWLSSILEHIFEVVQQINDENCVKRD